LDCTPDIVHGDIWLARIQHLGAPSSDPGAFFPVNVKFTAVGSLSEIGVKEVLDSSGSNVTFSQERIVEVDEFTIG
jgi:hypothetical protein